MPALSKPCKECPCRKTAAKGWLGDADIATGVERYEQYFLTDTPVACHMNPERFCRGVLHIYNNMLKLSRNPTVRAAQIEIKGEVGAGYCFKSTKEFLEYHSHKGEFKKPGQNKNL